ncbi:MAG: hypothetical protein QOD06_1706 [Candidatus Binatota bacterium]|nr:hypothetical protein [Candidatus Binatota bacterium]
MRATHFGCRGFTRAVAAVLVLATGCTVGPNYVRPPIAAPDAYKETAAGWKVAQPRAEQLHGPWWKMFGDPQLNALEEQVDISNQNVAAAEARYRQAVTLVEEARAAYYPTVSIGLGVSRARSPASAAGTAAQTVNDYTLPINASWEPDVWGRIRRNVEASQASAQASAADLEAARLSARTTLAQDYFLLRTQDVQQRLLEATVTAFERSLAMTRNQYQAGVVSRADVLQAKTLLETTRAQAVDVGIQRAQLEHAIALLVGTAASRFSLPAASLPTTPPDVPPGVPSELLERRPDVAAAERSVAAANAAIGVAEAAYFPTIILSAEGGLQSSSWARWFTWPMRFWSVGGTISETVYDGGLRHAQTDQARAAYDESVAAYRETVLAAFQSVEDALAALRLLADEARVQGGAVDLAKQTVTVITNQYEAGTVTYLNVITAQTTALADERTAIGILGNRMTTSVLLIAALGGGWDTTQLPEGRP